MTNTAEFTRTLSEHVPRELRGVRHGVDLTAPDGSKYQYRQPPTSTFLDAQITWRLPMTSARGALISLSGTNLLDNKVPMFAGVPEIGRLIMTRLQFTL